MHKVYRRIDQMAGNVLVLNADGVANGELAEITTSRGRRR